MTVITSEMPITLSLPPVKVGQDFSFTIQVKDDNRQPLDTTDWVMQITGRNKNANGDAVFDLTIGSGITHTPAEGKFVVKIPAATTALFDIPSIFWDCKITDDNDDVTYPFEGTLTVKESSTR